MRPRVVLILAVTTLAILAAPLAAGAQRAEKIPKIGVLTPGTAATTQGHFEAFRQGMRERGYIEGQHVVFVRRFGGDKPERLSGCRGRASPQQGGRDRDGHRPRDCTGQTTNSDDPDRDGQQH
jgi:hypothetical protein